MLLHQKDKVVEALLRHLVIPGSLATKTLLDLSVMLARDLREEFYPYFHRFLEAIVMLLDTRPEDVDLVEVTLGAALAAKLGESERMSFALGTDCQDDRSGPLKKSAGLENPD